MLWRKKIIQARYGVVHQKDFTPLAINLGVFLKQAPQQIPNVIWELPNIISWPNYNV